MNGRRQPPRLPRAASRWWRLKLLLVGVPLLVVGTVAMILGIPLLALCCLLPFRVAERVLTAASGLFEAIWR